MHARVHTPNCLLVYYYSLEATLRFGRMMKIGLLYGAKHGVHAFGYNSAERERIWMKSGAL